MTSIIHHAPPMKRKFDQFVNSNNPTLLSTTEEGELCARCCSIDLNAIFAKTHLEDSYSELIMELGPLELIKTSPCSMCRTLAASAPITTQNHPSHVQPFIEQGIYELRAFKAECVLVSFSRGFSEIILGVSPKILSHKAAYSANHARQKLLEETGYLCLSKPSPSTHMNDSFSVRVLRPEAIDLEIVKGWQAYCEMSHGHRCSDKGLPELERFSVFNCRTRKIVHAPKGCSYIALSYVWGQETDGSSGSSHPTNGDGRFEETIEDSVTVTLGLGMEYLWVDKLCVEQAHGEDKAFQIKQMDLIYAHAALTIIAAAGSDPSHGLPGINGKRRAPQTVFRFGSKELVSTLPSVRYIMRQSTWNTRGWTFQEGMLSRRRLIFTDHQVFFDCNSMHCAEAVQLPLDMVHTNQRQFDKVTMSMGALSDKAPGTKPMDYMRYLSEYSSRRLTYLSDRLDAFEGVLRAFSRARRPVYHFWGVPIFTDIGQMWHGSSHDKIERTVSSLFIINLFWDIDETTSVPTRITNFPSWSWAGWEGKVHGALPQSFVCKWSFTDAQVWLEDHHGSLSPLESIKTSSRTYNLHDTYSRFISIEGWTVPVSLAQLKFTNEEKSRRPSISSRQKTMTSSLPHDGWHVKFDVGDRTVYASLHCQTRLDSFLSGGHTFIGVLQSSKTTPTASMGRRGGMLLVSVGLHYERLGLFGLRNWWGWNEQGELESGESKHTTLQWQEFKSTKRIIRLG